MVIAQYHGYFAVFLHFPLDGLVRSVNILTIAAFLSTEAEADRSRFVVKRQSNDVKVCHTIYETSFI